MTPNTIVVMTAALIVVNLELTGLVLKSEKRTQSVAQQAGGAAHDSIQTQAGQPRDSGRSTHEYVLKPWRSLRAHLHNKIIHVPIGFALSGFFLSLMALRWKEVEPAVRWLVLIAAIGSLGAYFTGTNQALLLEGGSKDWVIQIHQKLGIASAILLWCWALTFWIARFNRWSLLVGAIVVVAITTTGFFGGVLAHG